MMNERLINLAIDLVENYNAAEGIVEQRVSIDARARNWYNHTEIVDAEMLATAVILGDYCPHFSWEKLLNAKEFYFPSAPLELENYHIHEIEEALNDADWW